MGEVLWSLFVAFVAGWFVRSELRERNNRKFDEVWTRYAREDYCPRCFRPDVVVVRADTKGVLYAACQACDQEVLL